MQDLLKSLIGAARRHTGIPHLVLWGLIGVLLVPAIGMGGFWWTDETRHAMGGVFILDLIRDMPVGDPMGYAFRYFAQYPALALNWYLPGFYAVEAVFYALFGISEATAHWTVVMFCAMASSVWLAWTRRTWGTAMALIATTLFLSVPAWNFWARSVMLEAPAIAMLILAIWFFERYLDKPTFSRAVLTGLVIGAALLVKQTVALILPALFIYGLWSPRRSAMWRWQAAPAYLFVLMAIAITAVHAVKFGGLGLAATVGDTRTELGLSASRLSLERWLLYPTVLVQTWGWPLLVMSGIGVLLPSKGNETRLPLLYAWLGCWYLAMTLVLGAPGNAPRYALYVLPVLAAFAARPIFLLRENAKIRAVVVVMLVAAIGFNVWRSIKQPVPYVNGYREAAEFVSEQHTKSPMLFAGKHDGSFIFHLRRLADKRNDVVLRADKVLVSLAVHKYFGMESHVNSLDDIRALIKRYGVEFIVIEQPDIVGVKEFGMLADLMQQPDFEKIKVMPVSSGGGAAAPERIEIYRYRDYQAMDDATIVIPLPHIGREIRFKRN